MANDMILHHHNFFEEITYMDIPSNREEAFADTNERQYYTLKQKVHIFMQ